MHLIINSRGTVKCLYDESIDLTAIGRLAIRRASHVEPDALGDWHADLAPVGGPKLGPFHSRSEALTAEVEWLEENHLPEKPKGPHDHKQPAVDHGLQYRPDSACAGTRAGNPASQGTANAAVGHHQQKTEDGE